MMLHRARARVSTRARSAEQKPGHSECSSRQQAHPVHTAPRARTQHTLQNPPETDHGPRSTRALHRKGAPCEAVVVVIDLDEAKLKQHRAPHRAVGALRKMTAAAARFLLLPPCTYPSLIPFPPPPAVHATRVARRLLDHLAPHLMSSECSSRAPPCGCAREPAGSSALASRTVCHEQPHE